MKLNKISTTFLLVAIGLFGFNAMAQTQAFSLESKVKQILEPFQCKTEQSNHSSKIRLCHLKEDTSKTFRLSYFEGADSLSFSLEFKNNMSVADFKISFEEIADVMLPALMSAWPETGGSVLCFNNSGSIRPPEINPEALFVDSYVSNQVQAQNSSFIQILDRGFSFRQCFIA